jgi:hypothetical protein
MDDDGAGWSNPTSYRLVLAQHDELGDHAGQSKPENHENEFCQNGGVIVGHEYLPAYGR